MNIIVMQNNNLLLTKNVKQCIIQKKNYQHFLHSVLQHTQGFEGKAPMLIFLCTERSCPRCYWFSVECILRVGDTEIGHVLSFQKYSFMILNNISPVYVALQSLMVYLYFFLNFMSFRKWFT